jgi:cobalt-zinc-cadmium efflux system membrane fusion protein
MPQILVPRSTATRPFFAATLIAAVLALAACQGKSESTAAAAPAKTAAPAAKPDGDFVDLEPSMASGVHVEAVREQALPRVLTATGKIQFNEDRTARVLAPLPGQVMDLQVRVGDTVEKDAVLFSIRSREVAGLVADLLQAHRDQDLAEKSYAMTKDLFDHQAASRIQFQQSEADVAKSKAQVARSEEALRVFGLDPAQVLQTTGVRTPVPVRSPLGGTVIERPVTPGQFVQADNTPLLTIADLSTVWVLLDVYESDLHRVHPGQRVEVTATAYPERRFTARVDRINDKVDPETRTLKVRLLVSNPGNLLKPEMFITASLVLDESVPTVTVPAKALFTEGDRMFAFVSAGEHRFERRLVTASADGDGRLRVTSGIKPGETVVADGALLLRLRQKQQEQPE